jgi:hypothetical protein
MKNNKTKNSEFNSFVEEVKNSLEKEKKEEKTPNKKEIKIVTQFKSTHEYRLLSCPKLLISKNDFKDPNSIRNIPNINKEWEYEYESCNRSKNIRVIVFNYLSDIFNYLEKRKYYLKKDQIDGNFEEKHKFNYLNDANNFNLYISKLVLFELPIIEETNLIDGTKKYFSIAEARKTIK